MINHVLLTPWYLGARCFHQESSRLPNIYTAATISFLGVRGTTPEKIETSPGTRRRRKNSQRVC